MWPPVIVPYNPFVVLFLTHMNWLVLDWKLNGTFYRSADLSAICFLFFHNLFWAPLASLDFQFWILKSGGPCSLTVSSKHIESRKAVNWSIVGTISFVSYFSGITVLSCLMPSVLQNNCFIHFDQFSTVSDWRVNLVTVIASWVKAFQFMFLKTTLLCGEQTGRQVISLNIRLVCFLTSKIQAM